MKLLLLPLLLLVGCADVEVGECLLRDSGMHIIKVTKVLEHGFVAEYHISLTRKMHENGIAYISETAELYRTYDLLDEYKRVDCESIYINEAR